MRSLVLLVVLLQTAEFAGFPKPTGYVNDFSNILPATTRGEIEQLLRDIEKETTAEIVVATVPSLAGMTVDEYANRLFNEWGIGKESVNNGVLVLVAPTEREMRIEVGYGLERVLPNALAIEIIRTNFLPRFKENDYPGGIQAGVARVVDVVRRNQVLSAEEREALEASTSQQPPMWLTIPFFGLFVSIGFFMLGAGLGSKTGFPVLFGSFFGGAPFLMSLVFNASAYVLGPLAVAAMAYGYRNGRRHPSWINAMRNTPTGAGGTGGTGGRWVMGGSSSSRSSRSGSSGSSGGSSFGGGSSGGGGASGRW